MVTNVICWSLFCQVFRQFRCPSRGQDRLKKGTKNGTSFGTCSLRHSGVRKSPKRKINERGGKWKAVGNILSSRKGMKTDLDYSFTFSSRAMDPLGLPEFFGKNTYCINIRTIANTRTSTSIRTSTGTKKHDF